MTPVDVSRACLQHIHLHIVLHRILNTRERTHTCTVTCSTPLQSSGRTTCPDKYLISLRAIYGHSVFNGQWLVLATYWLYDWKSCHRPMSDTGERNFCVFLLALSCSSCFLRVFTFLSHLLHILIPAFSYSGSAWRLPVLKRINEFKCYEILWKKENSHVPAFSYSSCCRYVSSLHYKSTNYCVVVHCAHCPTSSLFLSLRYATECSRALRVGQCKNVL